MGTFVYTCGDINGIGPEIVIKAINKIPPSKFRNVIFICPKNIFTNTIKIVKPTFNFFISKEIPNNLSGDKVLVLDIGNKKQNIGMDTAVAGRVSYNAIKQACKLCDNSLGDAIITAPISKLSFELAGITFPGHTELLADYFGVKDFSMMFISNKFKAGLVTIHVPLKNVPKLLTTKNLNKTINVIRKSLVEDFGISKPQIALLGLNPHAGEKGKIGLEEIKIIEPIMKTHREFLFGPFVPDAYFGNHLYKNYDCTIGLYHDQILIPFKLLNFNSGVNFTAGLPIVRTSPDHGTAFDIAGKGVANAQSIIEATKLAALIVKNRNLVREFS